MITENEIWNQLGAEGHTYWATAGEPERIAVADHSMRIRDQPGSQDDGLLILDRGRWIVFCPLEHNTITIPLLKPDGSTTQTCGSIKEAVFLARKFGLYIYIEGALFMPAAIPCAVPGCLEQSVTHMMISINNNPRRLLPTCKVHTDATLEDNKQK